MPQPDLFDLRNGKQSSTAGPDDDVDGDMAAPETDPEQVRDQAYADVDVTEKQDEYMRVCWHIRGRARQSY